VAFALVGPVGKATAGAPAPVAAEAAAS
jgi:hypothetical protein